MGVRRSWMSLPLLMLGLSSAAGADEPTTAQALAAGAPRSLLSSEWTDPYRETLEPSLESPRWQSFRLRKGGVEVRRSLQVGARDVELGVRGPLLKKKRLGLKLEVRF